MLAECLNKIAYGCFECFSAYFTLGFLGLPSAIFRPYKEDLLNNCSFETRYFTHIYCRILNQFPRGEMSFMGQHRYFRNYPEDTASLNQGSQGSLLHKISGTADLRL
jgi:hypothetical protein